jgi:hypothetical protein
MNTGKSLGRVRSATGQSDVIDERSFDFDEQEQEVQQRLQAVRKKYPRA